MEGSKILYTNAFHDMHNHLYDMLNKETHANIFILLSIMQT